MDVSVIIVNYKTVDLTCNCIQSIRDITSGVEYEVIVVDNNSDDGSVEKIREFDTTVRVIENAENYGFGRANNIGVNSASGKYVFFLNSDTILNNNAIDHFFKYFELCKKNEGESINYVLGANLIDINGRVINSGGELPDFKHLFIRTIYMYFPWLLRIRKHAKPIDYPVIERDVGFISGADIFMERDFFLQIGGFDENFFMYCEDADLCRRATLNGARCHIISEPKIIHLESQSSGYSKKRRKIELGSNIYYIKKNILTNKQKI